MNKFFANLKDYVTSACAYLFSLGMAGIGLSSQITLPKPIVVASYSAVAVSGAITLVLTGKNPDGSTKTDAQIKAQNTKEPLTGLSDAKPPMQP